MIARRGGRRLRPPMHRWRGLADLLATCKKRLVIITAVDRNKPGPDDNNADILSVDIV